MKELIKSPLLRAILGFLAFVLLSLAIWFIGPLLAFGDLHPLGSVALRVTAIGLLLVLLVLLLLDWPVSVVGVTCLCLLIWNAGPLLAFGSAVPLATEGMRWLVIGLVVLCFLVWAGYTLWNLMRNDQEFANRMLKRNKDAPKVVGKERIHAINELAKKAVAQLKEMHMTMAGGTGSVVSGLRRLVEGKRYLYELPWYMIIGTPGAGKTSALLNSGLSFPVAEQMGTASAQMTLAKNSGTDNCVWWFTNEAVLIDTAGRYTNPDDGLVVVTRPEPVVEEGKPKPEPEPPAELVNRAEWKGFLHVLRNVRSRAPINGALLAVDVAKLLRDDDAQLMAHAALLRARLGELRQELSIRFPVYVVLTKTDVLKGFVDYFSSLTTEARAQVWGFTLPLKDEDRGFLSGKLKKADSAAQHGANTVGVDWPLAKQVEFEMAALQSRLAQGVATRLQEEFELDRRQALYVLPQELAALGPRLAKLLDAVFSDSRFDTTQLTHTLRGVYLTSVMQFEDEKPVTADSTALVPRLKRGLSKLASGLSGSMPATRQAAGIVRGQASQSASSIRSYFVSDALMRVVFAESHLVKPNLKWEARFRLLRLLGHAFVITVFVWVAGGLILSHANNKSYLEDVGKRTEGIAQHIQQLYTKMSMPKTSEVLTLAQVLPSHTGLDLANPSSAFGFGLYSAEPVVQVAEVAYNNLQDILILPILIQRMEYVLRDAVATKDAQSAYEALRVYLLLHDATHYRETPNAANDLRNWIFNDWQNSAGSDTDTATEAKGTAAKSSAKTKLAATSNGKVPPTPPPKVPGAQGLAPRFENSTAMMGQLEAMFAGRRVVQSSTAVNEALVRQVRSFLDGSSSSKRLYERAKAELLNDAPQDFTLVRALGPQAGTLFRRASGQTIEKGIPGLFTYDGYHELFAKRLPEMIALAQKEDAWVMGRQLSAHKASSGADTAAKSKAESQALTEEIRRHYLGDYAEYWTDFLNDIRVVQAEGAGSLSFELNILRQFAAPDSPLVRLARMAARETTLSRPLQTKTEAEKSLIDKANDQIHQNKAKAGQNLGLTMRPEQRTERLEVDERFSALREVVTGQSEGAGAPSGKPALEGITAALNDYYTLLLVADSAISAGSLPPPGAEAATKLRIEAGKLPAPFREVFLGVSASGAGQIANGAATILRVQAQAQMDRLVGLMALMVSEPCRRNIAGRYPFSASTQEVVVEDFNALFASGGAADEYFTKYLMSLVDTSTRPWRYKAPGAFNALSGTEGLASGQALAPAVVGPTLTGELVKLLAASGPNPDSFAQMAQIREVFFREPGAKRMAWKLDMTVQRLDPTVTELVLDIDGQSHRYAHGPVQTMSVQWPGPRGGTMTEITAFPRIKSDTSAVSARGPWALLRMAEKGKLINSANPGQVSVEFLFDNRRAVVGFSGAGTLALTGSLLKNFNCPGRSA